MKSDRWRDLEAILHDALAREPHERTAFIADACAGDHELRLEIESLLAHETTTGRFLSTPAAALIAGPEEPVPFVGRQFGTHTIVGLLGSGGMGEVYRARDRPHAPNGGTSQPLPGDGRSVFYLVRQGAVRFAGVGERAGELWATDLETGRPRSVLPGRQVIGFDVSRDGTQVAFAALDDRGTSHVWLTRLDRPGATRRLAEFASDSPRFDAAGNIFFRGTVEGTSFIYRVREGRAPEKALQQPVLFFLTTSPDGSWLIAKVQPGDRQVGYQFNVAFPTAGGPSVPLCDNDCDVDWTSNGKSLVVRRNPGAAARTFLIPLESGSMLPRWPAQGIRSREDLNHWRIAREIEGWIYPSDTGSTYVFTRRTTQRNIHRIPLP